MTAEQLIEKLTAGYVITKGQLIQEIVNIKTTEYERGCEAMRHKLTEIMKRRKALKTHRNSQLFNKIIEQISDHIWNEKQKLYYGEELQRHPSKRDGAVPGKKVWKSYKRKKDERLRDKEEVQI